MDSIGEWWLWLFFIFIITTVLTIDLVLFGGKKHYHMTLQKALAWSGVWVSIAISFNIFLWIYLVQNYPPSFAHQKALEFFACYLMEFSLSLDNVFVFLMIFQYFSIPLDYQRRLLLFGVLGAIIMRYIFIMTGMWLIHKFDWIFYIFGLVLIYSAFRMSTFGDDKNAISGNFILTFLSKKLPVTDSIKSEYFYIKENGRFLFTPLFIALIFIELSDLIFAVDSIPAVFGITDDLFIAFASNAFAVMGLRALYFVLAHIHNKFSLLKYALAFILCFIGIKMMLHNFIHIPIIFTLTIIVLSLSIAVIVSKKLDKKHHF
jgi:tellurite resistance protein TerC